MLIFFGKWRQKSYICVCFSKHKFSWITFFRPIQIQIYLVVPKIGQCEYKYDYSDWYLKKKKYEYEYIQHKMKYMLMNINAIQVCKLIDIFAIIYDYCIGLKIIEKKIYFLILFHIYSTKWPKAANFWVQRCNPWCLTFSSFG